MTLSRRTLLGLCSLAWPGAALAQTRTPANPFDYLAKPGKEAPGRRAIEARAKAKADPAIEQILGRISPQRIQRRLDDLVRFGTRWSQSPNLHEVTNWLRAEFSSAGMPSDRIRLQE